MAIETKRSWQVIQRPGAGRQGVARGPRARTKTYSLRRRGGRSIVAGQHRGKGKVTRLGRRLLTAAQAGVRRPSAARCACTGGGLQHLLSRRRWAFAATKASTAARASCHISRNTGRRAQLQAGRRGRGREGIKVESVGLPTTLGQDSLYTAGRRGVGATGWRRRSRSGSRRAGRTGPRSPT